jgi:hypothetical protein
MLICDHKIFIKLRKDFSLLGEEFTPFSHKTVREESTSIAKVVSYFRRYFLSVASIRAASIADY